MTKRHGWQWLHMDNHRGIRVNQKRVNQPINSWCEWFITSNKPVTKTARCWDGTAPCREMAQCHAGRVAPGDMRLDKGLGLTNILVHTTVLYIDSFTIVSVYLTNGCFNTGQMYQWSNIIAYCTVSNHEWLLHCSTVLYCTTSEIAFKDCTHGVKKIPWAAKQQHHVNDHWSSQSLHSPRNPGILFQRCFVWLCPGDQWARSFGGCALGRCSCCTVDKIAKHVLKETAIVHWGC